MDNNFIFATTVEESTQTQVNNKQNKPFSQDILLIEDDSVCLFVGQEIFSRLTSGKVDVAKTVTAAKKKLKQHLYDLVVSDLCLGGGNAVNIITEVQTQSESKNKNTSFVALTAYLELDKHQEALAAGFKEVMTKPLTEDQARRLLQNDLINKNSDEASNIRRPVIDLKLGMERIGVYTKEKAVQALEILIVSLSEDLALLKQAENQQDHATMNDILHKIVGALHYSATPALEESVQDLQVILETRSATALSAGIQNIEEQVKLLKAAYYDLLMHESY